ncbi:MAG TPA: subclass B1 metallo-beta-lactamase [Flavipsychrobacter sp.]
MKATINTILSLLLLSMPIITSAQYTLKTTQVDSNIYLYISYGDVGNYKNIDANAVVLVSGNEAMLFDTPWDSTQAKQLISWVTDSLDKKIILSVITHAHADRIGSIATMHRYGIPTYSHHLTAQEALKRGYPRPRHVFYNDDTTFRCGDIEVIAYYPGAGHTIDNIVLYVPYKKFLYGGCFIKSGFSTDIGNIEDADIAAWPQSITKMKKRFEKTGFNMVIPGHGSWESNRAIENTMRLLTETAKSDY